MRRLQNEELTEWDDRNGYKAAFQTPDQMLYWYGNPEYNTPPDDSTPMTIGRMVPRHHLRQFECYISPLKRKKHTTDTKIVGRSKACMIVGYIYKSTTSGRIWYPVHNTVNAQSDVMFDEERYAYISCAQSLKC